MKNLLLIKEEKKEEGNKNGNDDWLILGMAINNYSSEINERVEAALEIFKLKHRYTRVGRKFFN